MTACEMKNGDVTVTLLPTVERQRFQIFSYIMQSRSLALGQVAIPGLTDSIDLEDEFGYDGAHYGHSREFRSNIVRERVVWKRICGKIKWEGMQ